MDIQTIIPSFRREWHDETLEKRQRYVSAGTSIHVKFLDYGPESIESDYDVALALPEILRLTELAEADGMQAVIIDCMADPGLHAMRELVNIPVVGPAQASMSLAATLADRFSVVSILERDRPFIHNQWRLYGLTGHGASVRSIDMAVTELHDDNNRMLEAMSAASILAVQEDDAHAIVFGCTGMGGKFANAVQENLAAAGYEGIPAIDPTGVAIRTAEMLVTLGISHSKRTFPAPPKKTITGYEQHSISDI